MAQILVRNLAQQTVRRLKARAKQAGRSLQAEAKDILQREARRKTMLEALKEADRICAQIAKRGPQKTDSTQLIREDRGW